MIEIRKKIKVITSEKQLVSPIKDNKKLVLMFFHLVFGRILWSKIH